MVELSIKVAALLMTCQLLMTSTTHALKGVSEADAECHLCRRLCDIDDCLCKNVCIRGTGNDCQRVDMTSLSSSARACVGACKGKVDSCRKDCIARC